MKKKQKKKGNERGKKNPEANASGLQKNAYENEC